MRLLRRTFGTCAAFLKKQIPNLKYIPQMSSYHLPDAFLPPVNRSMKELDREFFKKTVSLSALAVPDLKKLSKLLQELKRTNDILDLSALHAVVDNLHQPERKIIILDHKINVHEPTTWTPTIHKLIQEEKLSMVPYDLHLTYDNWSMRDILEAIIPEPSEHDDAFQETPTGFSQVGHVAHLNLRDNYLPWKYLIGEVLLDKVERARTVINKVEDVGSTDNPYRTFPYEVLAGPDDMDVTVNDNGCIFEFNFAKVYWNSRLNTEHKRIIDKFQQGEMVCDVMAGVGPFAIPAAKKQVFVWANDLNPDAASALKWAVDKNKVNNFVRPYNVDGREFIRLVIKIATTDKWMARLPRKLQQKSQKIRNEALSQQVPIRYRPVSPRSIFAPRVFDHFIMNLPATAVEFLDAFKGVYEGHEDLFRDRELPLIHLYCFQRKLDTLDAEAAAVFQMVSKYLGARVTADMADSEAWYVRLVSPKKKMYCATFRLPAEVAFSRQNG